MSKPFSFSLTVLLVASLIIFSSIHFGVAQSSGTSVQGIIATDTIWTQANGPYTLIGNLLVNNGATLTIQAGTAVNIGNYYLMVNGTLQAIGTNSNPVTFTSTQGYYSSSSNAEQLIFTPYCNGYSTTTNSGCTIQNAIVNSPLTISNAVEIAQDYINDGISVLSQPGTRQTGTPIIFNNTIRGGITIGSTDGNAIITNNYIIGNGISFGSPESPDVTITGNVITACIAGISVGCWGSIMTIPVQFIGNNLIENNSQGILLQDYEGGSYPAIENNTITNNTVGICVSYPYGNTKPTLTASITGNNIYNNTKYDFQNEQPTTITASYNWWGTTDTQAISQKIYDYYDDFTLGVVTYTPFLTAPNPFAQAYESPIIPTNTSEPTPTPTLTPTQSPSPTPSLPPTNSTPTPTPSALPSASPTPIQTPTAGNTNQSSTLQAVTDEGAVVDIPLTGDITPDQISNIIIATNQSASMTVLSFTLTGPSGTIGFSNMTIPKAFIPYGKVPVIFIDDQRAENQGYTQDSNCYYVWYTTHFSTHQVSVEFTASTNSEPNGGSIQQNPYEVLVGALIGIIIVLIVMIALKLFMTSGKR